MTEDALAEIRAMFGGLPRVFARMHEAGDLTQMWPEFRELYTRPDPLPRAVVDALLAAFALRCRSERCSMFRMLDPDGEVESLDIARLAEHLIVPPEVPDARRWSEIVRLAWLADAPGPQRRAAGHALVRACTPAEHGRVLETCAIGTLLAIYVGGSEHDLDDPLPLEAMPEEIRGLVPTFVQYHATLGAGEAARPVCTICAHCHDVRSTTDRAWYPRSIVLELLPEDALFSHGMCDACFDRVDSF